MRVAVTGAAGYVGGRLVETLTALDADVLALVSTRRPWLATRQVEVDLRGPAGALVTALDVEWGRRTRGRISEIRKDAQQRGADNSTVSRPGG